MFGLPILCVNYTALVQHSKPEILSQSLFDDVAVKAIDGLFRNIDPSFATWLLHSLKEASVVCEHSPNSPCAQE